MAKDGSRIDYLIRDKEEFRQKVEERLKTGREFINRQMTTLSDSDICWKQFIIWDIYNLEMIKQAFDHPDNHYADYYDRLKQSAGVYFSGNYEVPSINIQIENVRNEMNAQVWKLERFLEKIELLKVKPDLQSLKPFANSAFNNLLTILNRFHKIAQKFRDRRAYREPFIIKDEYDVQYLLGALLKLYFDDIRPEDYSPSYAGANTRIDFILKDEQIILEIKMTNDHLKAKTLGEELLVDVGRYKEYPNCSNIVIFIYDKGDHIINKRGFINDIERQSTDKLKVKAIIQPE